MLRRAPIAVRVKAAFVLAGAAFVTRYFKSALSNSFGFNSGE
jgi:hypothetical protein